MLVYVARRVAAGVLLLLVISFLTFVLLSIPGQDVGRTILGLNASDAAVAATVNLAFWSRMKLLYCNRFGSSSEI